MKKVVTIGGGTGQYTLLRGLKNYDTSLSAIVSMVDDGGSTGLLRDEYGLLPSGDVRRCLIALADEERAKILRPLFEVRFDEKLKNHNFGNLLLFALEKVTGDYVTAIKEAEKILGVKGKVIPISLDKTEIMGKTVSGKQLEGQTQVSYDSGKDRISEIWLNPSAFIYKEAATEIREADLTIICPGDLYGSILPNFLVKGAREVLQESKSKLVYVCNLVTKQGSHNFKASDFVREIERYAGRTIDYIILNSKKPEQKVVDKYKAEDSLFVEPDLESSNVIKENLLLEHKSDGKILARHDLEKTARIIMELA